MLDVLPKRVLFHFELPIHQCTRPPRLDGDASKWARKYMAPPLVEVENTPPIADAYWAWDHDAFYFAVDVPQRTARPACDARHWWKGDGVRLCLATREPRELRRGNRFCHLFYFLPLGGRDGRTPVAGTHRLSRAKESPPASDVGAITVAARVERTGYSLEAVIPSTCLHGWDPAEHPRIGVYYKIKDLQRGSQHLSADDELGWNADPTTWATGVLVK